MNSLNYFNFNQAKQIKLDIKKDLFTKEISSFEENLNFISIFAFTKKEMEKIIDLDEEINEFTLSDIESFLANFLKENFLIPNLIIKENAQKYIYKICEWETKDDIKEILNWTILEAIKKFILLQKYRNIPNKEWNLEIEFINNEFEFTYKYETNAKVTNTIKKLSNSSITQEFFQLYKSSIYILNLFKKNKFIDFRELIKENNAWKSLTWFVYWTYNNDNINKYHNITANIVNYIMSEPGWCFREIEEKYNFKLDDDLINNIWENIINKYQEMIDKNN